MHEFPYFIGLIPLFLLWLYFYFKRKDLRHQQITVGIFTAPLAPVSQVLFFSKDYWNPEYIVPFRIAGVPLGIEELLFAFIAGGVGSVFYEVIFKKKHVTGKKRFLLPFIAILCSAILFYLLFRLGVSSIWASSAALFALSLGIMALDKDLRTDLLWSGIFMVGSAVVVYIALLYLYPDLIHLLWVDGGLSGVTWLRIPIEEIVWFFTFGTAIGAMYEFVKNVDGYLPLKKRA